MTLKMKVLALLETGEKTTDQLVKEAKLINVQSAHSAIYELRRAGNKIRYDHASNSYSLVKVATPVTMNQTQPTTNPSIQTSGINRSFISRLRKLNHQDRADALDLLKKSLIYRGSAEAVLAANERISELEEELCV